MHALALIFKKINKYIVFLLGPFQFLIGPFQANQICFIKPLFINNILRFFFCHCCLYFYIALIWTFFFLLLLRTFRFCDSIWMKKLSSELISLRQKQIWHGGVIPKRSNAIVSICCNVVAEIHGSIPEIIHVTFND